MSKATESFEIIQRMVSTAKASWAIWFQLYCNFEHGGPYAVVTQIHFPFFNAVYHSQIHYVFLILSDLFGKRKDTHSFSHLIKLCRSEGLDDKTAKKCEALIRSVQHYSRGVGILRGKHFGHKVIHTTLPEALKEAGLKIKDIDAMLEASTRIISKLAFPFSLEPDKIDWDSDESAKQITIKILQMLLDKFNELGKPKA